LKDRAVAAAPFPPKKDEIYARVAAILVDSFELDAGEVRPDAHLIDDLDLDSIDAIDLVVSLESETDLDVTEDELKALRVVQDIVDLVHRKLVEAGRAGA
jgi:acyl carrier protein